MGAVRRLPDPHQGRGASPLTGGYVSRMPKEIGTDDALRLHREGAQFVEVLDRGEFEREHIPGAAHLGLAALEERADEVLDRDRPVVAYCFDHQ